MATVVLTQHTIGAPFNGTTHNNNLQLIENSLADLGPYVISGLTFAAGTGLSATVAAGVVDIGGRITSAGFTITGLADANTNHLYILNTGAGAHNTTGTAPANSAKLGTATTAGGVVTSVAMGRTSGRQQFQQPQNLVHGGPSAGTASAGHPRAVNLAQWNATQAEGFEVFGTLPAGATSAGAVILAPNTPTRNTIQPTADANAGLKIKQFSPTQSEVLLGIYLSTNDLCFQVGPSGKCDVVGQVDTPMLSLATSGSYAPTRNLFEITGNNATGGYTGELYFGPDCSLLFWAPTTGSNDEKACSLYPGMADNTDATWKGRLRLTAWDFNGEREGLRIDADGAAARIGFLGAAAVVRPAATTDLRQGLIDLGLYTTGGATPLNLNGGVFTTTGNGNALGRTTFTGSIAAPEVATSSNTTLDGTHFSIFEDTTGGNKTVTLPTAVGIAGRIYCIKNTGTGANTLTIATTSAQTIDGAAGASTSTPQACLIVQSDGANWQTLSSN